MMNNIIHKNIVLVLNKNWQAIAITTPAGAYAQMATDAATGLDVHGEEWMIPVRWGDWQDLPVREEDFSIGIASGRMRVPTVIVLCRYAKVPMHQPRLCSRNIWLRDGGVCQYTGKTLQPNEGNIDHVLPQSRGGPTSWENCVLSSRVVNNKKADRTPKEAGLKLVKPPSQPRSVPITQTLKNVYDIDDWKPFLMSTGTE